MGNKPAQVISEEELSHYRDLARQYARKSLSHLCDTDYPDIYIDRLREQLKIAFDIGIAASPDPSMPGSAYGIWGSAIDDYGMTTSLLLLSIIAETCGGAAMSLHAQGLASNLALRAKRRPGPIPARVGLCLQEGISPPHLGAIVTPDLEVPARVATAATAADGVYTISGVKSFVYSMDGVEAYVVLARVGADWGCFLVPANHDRIAASEVGARTGLRACCLKHIEFKQVMVPREARIDNGDARELVIRALGLNWAGMSAIAVGIAKGAAASARNYVEQRYQGGTRIEQLPAVKTLIGGAEAAIQAAESSVLSFNQGNFTDFPDLAKPARTKLAVTELCARAVTDLLQTFGGYGYMEDFGMEKRLRDIAVLKSASGSPAFLRQFIFDIEKERAR